MRHADALSRAPINSIAVQDISYSEIAQEQEEDPNIRVKFIGFRIIVTR